MVIRNESRNESEMKNRFTCESSCCGFGPSFLIQNWSKHMWEKWFFWNQKWIRREITCRSIVFHVGIHFWKVLNPNSLLHYFFFFKNGLRENRRTEMNEIDTCERLEISKSFISDPDFPRNEELWNQKWRITCESDCFRHFRKSEMKKIEPKFQKNTIERWY